MSHKDWNRLLHALQGNTGGASTTAPARIVVSLWNTAGLGGLMLDGGHSPATGKKLAWLDDYLSAARPAVLCLLEVSGTWGAAGKGKSPGAPRLLRAWFGVRGYEIRMLIGQEGAGRSGGHEKGVIFAVDRKQGQIRGAQALAVRCLRISVFHKADGRTRQYVGMHGINAETQGGLRSTVSGEGLPVRSFARQLAAASDELEMTGGLLLADFNKVPDALWRRGGLHVASPDDMRLRKVVLGAGGVGTASPEPAGLCRVVGGLRVDPDGASGWTRFAAPAGGHRAGAGEWGEPSARLDAAIAFGEELGGWVIDDRVFPEMVGPGPRWDTIPLSDHVLMEFSRFVVPAGIRNGGRPMPVNVRKTDKKGAATAALIAQRAGGGSVTGDLFALKVKEVAGAAHGDGLSRTEAVVREIDSMARAAQAEVEQEGTRRRAKAGGPIRGTASAKCMHRMWLDRLREAYRLRKRGEDARLIRGGILFHHRTGLCHIRDKCASPDCWPDIVRFCRKELRVASARQGAARAAESKKLMALAEELERIPAEEASKKLQVAHRMTSMRRPGGAPEFAYIKDDPAAELVPFTDPRFLEVVGAIGKQTVEGYDNGASLEAFAAWCD